MALHSALPTHFEMAALLVARSLFESAANQLVPSKFFVHVRLSMHWAAPMCFEMMVVLLPFLFVAAVPLLVSLLYAVALYTLPLLTCFGMAAHLALPVRVSAAAILIVLTILMLPILFVARLFLVALSPFRLPMALTVPILYGVQKLVASVSSSPPPLLLVLNLLMVSTLSVVPLLLVSLFLFRLPLTLKLVVVPVLYSLFSVSTFFVMQLFVLVSRLVSVPMLCSLFSALTFFVF